jgi:protein-disulfide isomerase
MTRRAPAVASGVAVALVMLASAVAAHDARAQAATTAAGAIPVYQRGPDGAAVEVVEFCDFEAKACGDLSFVLAGLVHAYPEQVRFIFRHRAGDAQLNSDMAFQAALAAGEQDRFWPMHDLLFANQHTLDREHLLGMAAQAGLDVARFTTDLDSGRFAVGIERDRLEAERLGVTKTPVVFVNGHAVDARTLDTLKVLVDREIVQKTAR